MKTTYPVMITSLFTDEKIFRVATTKNSQNDQLYARTVGLTKKKDVWAERERERERERAPLCMIDVQSVADDAVGLSRFDYCYFARRSGCEVL